MQIDKQKKREYCEILGVSEAADEESVKRAYKRLALEYHPDRPINKGKEDEASMKFKRVTEAYEKLQASNTALSNLKTIFKSQEIHSSLEHFLFTTGNSVNFQFNSASSADLRGASGSFSTKLHKKGQSLRTVLKIKFEESLYGCQKLIEFTRTLICSRCGGLKTHPSITPSNSSSGVPSLNGFGSFSNASMKLGSILNGVTLTSHSIPGVCRDCGGKGVLKAVLNGGPSVSTPCPTCTNSSSTPSSFSSKDKRTHQNSRSHPNITPSNSGTATDSHHKSSMDDIPSCSSCSGLGRITERKTCAVEVPPSVISGMQRIFEGEGDESEDGGISGDLIVCFEVESHPFYVRKGDDVHCSLPLQFAQLCLGSSLEFRSLYGKKIEVKIRPGTHHNEIIKIEQEGFQSISLTSSTSDRRGDLYLQVVLVIPQEKNITDQERELLNQLSTTPNFKPLFRSNHSSS